MDNSDDIQLATVVDQLLKVTCAMAVQGKSLSEAAPLLERLSVDRSITAAIYDTSEGSVRAILSQAKKTQPKSKAKS